MTRYADRKAQGLCTKCGYPNDLSGVQCLACREKIRDRENRRNAERRRAGLCATCEEPLASTDGWRCEGCREYQRLWAMDRRDQRARMVS